ncbi:MAG: hypothetical protein HC777_02535 [Hyphomonadaceae bacterium]|nr:hypothetical protein [Hyphomonadaceae bacterium]
MPAARLYKDAIMGTTRHLLPWFATRSWYGPWFGAWFWTQSRQVLLAAMLALLATACTTAQTRVAKVLPERPAAGSGILVLQPDIELSLLTASSLTEPNSQWSNDAAANIRASLKAALETRQHRFILVDPNQIISGRANQVLRLHEAVATSILAFNYGLETLPTRRSNDFNWTLGPGALELARLEADGTGAKYALITVGRGTYASGGRWAMAIVGTALGANVPMGGQQVYASLVELSTGNVVWFNLAIAGPQDDMRTNGGATALVTSLLKDVPL